MNWSTESTIQDKIFNLTEKVRKHKLYFIIGLIVLISSIILLSSVIGNSNKKYIELLGSDVINLYTGDTYKELGYKAYDNDNNDFTDDVIVDSNLNTNIPGKYEITYKIGKSSIKRTVIVLEKQKEYYNIILNKVNDEENIYLALNSEFEDPGYQIFDNKGVDITENIDVEIKGEVDTSKSGTYNLVYEFMGPNKEILSTKRDVVVIDNKLDLSLSATDYTSSDVTINISVADEYFDYILMPNETKVEKKEHMYLVTENGTYKFVLYNKKGFNIEKEIEVKNIDREQPTGTCNSFIRNGRTTVQISANDNIGIKSYQINGKSYTESEITLDKILDKVIVKLYDEAGNINEISCYSSIKSIILTKNTTNYTNDKVDVTAIVTDDNFKYLKLPNGNTSNSKNYVYSITENGTYTFSSYDNNNEVMEESITINNIDKVLPTGSCEVKKDSKDYYIEINASDNIGIKNYIYNSKIYSTNKIILTSVPSNASVRVYDKANNNISINCVNTVVPVLNSVTKDGVIVNISASKAASDIAGYYFSYTNTRPNKDTGGYLATSNTEFDVVRLPGTTYVWVEDKDGNISEPKSVTISTDALLITKGTKYTKLEGTKLSTYLTNKGWSIEELNKLIARSTRAAGLYTKDAAATTAVALQTVLAQKYKIKLPYWWGGKSWSFGANSSWGVYKQTSNSSMNFYYYGLDCSGFTAWVYVNSGYNIKFNEYPGFWNYTSATISKENGDVGDFLTTSGHVKLIIGKTDTEFITAEANSKSEGMIVSTQSYVNKNGYVIRKAEDLMKKYPKKDISTIPSGF